MKVRTGIAVELTRRGFDYALRFDSIKSVARATGRAEMTVKHRLEDGLYLHTDTGVAVKVRYVK